MTRGAGPVQPSLPARLRAWRERRASARRLADAARRLGHADLIRQLDSPGRVFDAIHELNAWQGRESRSGRGSDLDNTVALRAELPGLLEQLGVRVLLDIPCGDFHWFSRMPLELEQYIGADRVGSLVADNQARFGDDRRRFIVRDITRDPLPSCDLVLCRDLLVHLSFDDIRRALDSIRDSGARWLLATHFTAPRRNVDIVSGDWRPLNLCRSPFALPPPERLIDEQYQGEGGAWRDKQLAFWSVDQL